MGKKRTKKIGPTRGFEARYGATVRKRYISVVTNLRKAYDCPQCGSTSVRRRSVGVWECGKCGAVFSGGAYMPTTKLGEVAKRAAKGLPVEVAPVKEESE